MRRKALVIAASVLVASAAVSFLLSSCVGVSGRARPQFVATDGIRFVVDGKPFRFVGANVAVMYRDADRARMPETLARAAQTGIRVVRVWTSGEGGPNDVGPVADFADWPRNHPLRWAPGHWNEEAFTHLDKVIA